MKRILLPWVVFFIFTAIFFQGCGKKKVFVAEPPASWEQPVVAESAYPMSANTDSVRYKAGISPQFYGNKAAVTPAEQPVDRQVIYQASIGMVVENIAETLEKIKELSTQVGGYMHSMNENSIVVKIPAALFSQVTEKVLKLGEVTRKEIKGDDVTDKLLDLDIRLISSKKMHERLLKLLDRADKMADAVQVEKEIARITETIEQLTGQIRQMKDQVLFSTLTVSLNASLPQHILVQEIPFAWVRDLGLDFLGGQRTWSKSRGFFRQVNFELPMGFAQYDNTSGVIRAMSADGLLLQVSRHDNVDGGDLQFWSDLVRRSLVENRGIKATAIREMTLNQGISARIIEGSKEIDGKKHHYQVAVAMNEKHIYTYEAWGEESLFRKKTSDVDASIKTLKILPFWKRLFR